MINTKSTATKRHYGHIDNKILIEGLASGMTYTEAGKLAGVSGTSEKSIAPVISRKIAKDVNLKKTLIQKIEERQNMIIDSINKEEILKAPLSQKSVSFGILVDKAELLKGNATNRIEVMPKMVIDQGSDSNKVLTEKEILARIEANKNKGTE